MAYKLKAKKVWLIDMNNKIRDGLRDLIDWYTRAKLREYKQEHVKKYKDHLLLKIIIILRGSRLTLKRLKALNVRT
jgi:hypothetical protein